MSSEGSLEKAGEALRAAREAHRPRRISVRAAAERAEISESRWRQIEQGFELRGGIRIPVSTTEDTLSYMAHAVGLDPAEIVTLAGMDPTRALTFDEPTSPAIEQARRVLQMARELPLGTPNKEAMIAELEALLRPPTEDPLNQTERPSETG